MSDKAEKIKDIADGNLSCAYDQRLDHESLVESLAAYLVNSVDTAREKSVSAEKVVEEFLREFRKQGGSFDEVRYSHRPDGVDASISTHPDNEWRLLNVVGDFFGKVKPKFQWLCYEACLDEPQVAIRHDTLGQIVEVAVDEDITVVRMGEITDWKKSRG